MARTIASLAVSLGLNSSGFVKGLDEAGRKAGGLRGAMGTMAKGVGIAAGVVSAAGASMLAMANQTSKTADEIDKMSIRTGISREQLQELRFAAGQTGVAFSAIESASSRMVGTLRTNEGAFEDMGIATRDASGNLRSADELFNETIRSLAAMDNEVERNIKGQELFGRGFTELIPLIEAGVDGIDDYAKQAHDLGSVLSDEAIAANVKYRDTMDAVKTAMQGAFVQTMNEVLPILQRFLDWVLQNMPQIQAVIRAVMQVVAGVVSRAFGIIDEVVLPLLSKIFQWVNENLPRIQQEFSERFETIRETIRAFVDIATTLWDTFGGTILSITGTIFSTLGGIIDGALKVIKGILDVFAGLFTGDWQRMGDGIKSIWEGIWKAVRAVISGVIDSAFGWGRDIMTGLVNGIKNMAMAPVNAVKDVAGNIGSAVKGFFGISSPSRLMEEYGRNISQGLQRGIDKVNINYPIPDLETAGAGAGTVYHVHRFDRPLRVEGVNNKSQLVDVVEVLMDKMYQERRG